MGVCVCVVGEKLLPVGGGRSHRPEVPMVEDKHLQPPKEDKRKENKLRKQKVNNKL